MIAFFAVGLLAGCGGGSGGGETPPNDDPPPSDDAGGDDDGDNTDDDTSDDDTNGDGSAAAFSTPTFFIGNDGSSGNTSDGSQLWKTDGTEAGTERVKVIAPGGGDAKIRDIIHVGDMVFFVADDGEGHGEQLWVSDGTEDGTERLTDSSSLDANTATMLVELDGTLYFRGRSADTSTVWIWKSDGTAEGTGPLADNEPLTNGLTSLTSFKNHLYLAANDGTNGQELWRVDGTGANVDMVANIQAGAGLGSLYSCPDAFVELDGMLYFSANEGANECALWRTNGELGHAEKVKDISDATNTGPANLVATDDSLFFLSGGGQTPSAIWVSDGTEAGTVKVLETDDQYQIMLGSSGVTGIGEPLLAAGDHAYFYVRDLSKHSTVALQLWYTNGSDEGLLVDLENNVLGGEIDMAVAAGQLFFVHTRPDKDSDFTTPNNGIWTAAGNEVELLHSEFTTINGGKPLLQAEGGSTLLFSSMGEVWRTDGTNAGTAFVSDICPGTCFGFKAD